VDMGGGSVQVAYKVAPRTQVTQDQSTYIKKLDDGNSVYLHSWLGFGLKAARMKILEQAETNACLARPVEYTYAGKTVKVAPTDSERTVDKCFAQVQTAMNLGTGCPVTLTPCAFDGGWRGPLDADHSVFLFSFIFDISRKLRLFHDGSYDNTLTVSQIVEASRQECSHPSHEEYLCLDSAFIATLVHKGLGLHLDTHVRVLNKILYEGHLFEGAWALGAALSNRR
jgi:hypothetical protein